MVVIHSELNMHPTDKPLYRPAPPTDEPCSCCKCWVTRRGETPLN